MIERFPAAVLGIAPPVIRARRSKPHKAHRWMIASRCPGCAAPLLRACTFRAARGRGFCVEVERVNKARHSCIYTMAVDIFGG